MTHEAPLVPADTRGRIIEAALQLMAERGFAGVTMKSVAETAGVARQTLYNHFSDVDTIAAAAIEAHQLESLGALHSMLATIESPLARLEHLVRHAAAAAVHHQPVATMLPGLSAEMQATLRRHETALVSIIEDALRAGVATGDFSPQLDVDRDAQLVKSMLDATAELTSRDPEAVQTVVAAATRTLLASVSAPS